MSKSLLHHVVDGVCHHLDLCLLLGCFSSGVLLWDSSLSRANLVVPIVPNSSMKHLMQIFQIMCMSSGTA